MVEELQPVRVALIGYGYWGGNIARNIVASRTTQLAGVIDAAADQRASAADTLPGVATWSSLAEAIDDGTLDAVVVATPASTHADLARQALTAGLHVLVEKPLAMTSSDADAVVEAAQRAGRVLAVGHTFLYSPPVQRLREYVRSGELGAVQYLASQRLSLGRIRRDCNALWNFAPHDVSIMMFLLDDRPVEVSARGFSFLQAGIEDVFFASLQFASGVGANLHVSWIDPRKTRLMTIVGSEKMAIYNDVSVDQKIWLVDAGVARSEDGFGEYDSLGDFQWRTRAGDIVIPKIDMVEPLRAELEDFGRACQMGAAPRADGRGGRDVVRVLEAIEESARQRGAPVTIEWKST